MSKKLLTPALVALLLTACSSDNDTTVAVNEPVAAEFTASIGAPTRAYDQTWEANDAIGIYGTSAAESFTNVKYATDGSNSFTAATAEKIYFQDNNTVTFTAYYPWNDIATATTVSADTRLQANQKTFDFLWAQAQGSKASRNVAFNFDHKMAKVVLTVKSGSDVTYQEVKDAILSLDGFLPAGSFDVTTGVATADANTAASAYVFAGNTTANNNAPITLDDVAETVTYSLILFPQTFSAKLPFTATLTGLQSFSTAIDFTAANADAGDATAANEWVAGRQYNISVTLNKTSITVDGCTINQWQQTNGGNFDAQ